ncbi:FecR domain-containing protein [Duganella phyllosphaerae]|uniref:Fec operon regulator FecR n=1 Tax=Duganella phyllosphaerae TaxID=762836 RepID=A0A1E7W637_9BURK|nr:FecR domain-containing protein [Duganella phyllosphaerae]OEZ91436.1 fec operon regulator FecR [Duganella phyllosphaerae]
MSMQRRHEHEQELEIRYATLEQAAEWFAILRSSRVTDDERQRWQDWLAADPDHRQAWARVEAISDGVAIVRVMPQAAGAALHAASEVRQRRTLLKTMVLAAVTVGVGWQVARQESVRDLVAGLAAAHRTGTGETRQVELADGTRLWLDTGTVVGVKYDAGQRLLVLHQGVILVDTHADIVHPARPFIVNSRQGAMRALGTRFVVRQLDDGETELAVSQGRVEITVFEGPSRVIAAGGQTCFTRHVIAATEAIEPARDAWTEGMLIAQDMPLVQFLAQLSRYRSGHLGCDPALAKLRVVGAFPLGDTDQALAMLEAALPVRVTYTLPWWVTVSAK